MGIDDYAISSILITAPNTRYKTLEGLSCYSNIPPRIKFSVTRQESSPQSPTISSSIVNFDFLPLPLALIFLLFSALFTSNSIVSKVFLFTPVDRLNSSFDNFSYGKKNIQ